MSLKSAVDLKMHALLVMQSVSLQVYAKQLLCILHFMCFILNQKKPPTFVEKNFKGIDVLKKSTDLFLRCSLF